jgi:hypothetical protein
MHSHQCHLNFFTRCISVRILIEKGEYPVGFIRSREVLLDVFNKHILCPVSGERVENTASELQASQSGGRFAKGEGKRPTRRDLFADSRAVFTIA